ncbi:unnamed protein product [Pylaiella littoralis]
MVTPELTTTTTTTTMLQGEEDEEIDHVQHERFRSIRPNPIAALIRQGAEEAGRLQGGSRATTKVQRMINSLQWRQAHSKDEIYPLPLESGVILEFRQLQAGEVTGLGTGATVWPAAHVLAKYLELRFGQNKTNTIGSVEGMGGMAGLRAVDLGSGTGVAGIVAAALGAEAFLTDQVQLLFLMQENADRARASAKSKSKSKSGTPKATLMDDKLGANAEMHFAAAAAAAAVAADPTTADDIPTTTCGKIRVLTYDWGMDDDRLSPPLDVVLVSDCVLPKLYPIEPLVDAIDRLSGPETVTIMSYEHRHYQAFDPRRRFEELAAAKGLVKSVIPQAQQHPIFSADDIEIWEVRRRQGQQQQQPQWADSHRQQNTARVVGDTERQPVQEEIMGTDHDILILSTLSPKSLSSSSSCREPPAEATAVGLAMTGAAATSEVRTATAVGIMGERHVLTQAPSGAAAAAAAAAASSEGEATEDGGPLASAGATTTRSTCREGALNQYPPHARALELGSGVGLVTMTAALLGWEVVGTDKSDALPILELNTTRCLSSTRRTSIGNVEVVEYDWGADAHNLLAGRNGGVPAGYDVVMCADCVYARASVEPLLESLLQVCDESTVVLVTNELRSAFDEFLQRARALEFEVEDVHVPEAQMVVDATSNQRPKPVALKRLRRRLAVLPVAPSKPS